jgi:hypothetical protein
VNVLFTIAVLAVVALWWIAVQNRLTRLRNQVKDAWKKLDADRGNAEARTAYNGSVARYNDALGPFPANIIAMMAGFKPAKPFEL